MFDKDPKHEVKEPQYIPAFGHSLLTPFYDFMMKWTARESTFKPRLVKQARIEKGQRILDLGCGTATLTMLIKKIQPSSEVTGIDADPEILEIAKTKVAKEGLDIALDYGTATKLSYSDDSFDHVFSSMVLHHLTREDKIKALKEVFRVLKHGGELHVADLGKPQNALMRLPSSIIGHMEKASDNLRDLVPDMLSSAGFGKIKETARYMTIFGTIVLIKAQKPRMASGKAIHDSREYTSPAARKAKPQKTSEDKYYLLLKRNFRMLSPFYDFLFNTLALGTEPQLREKVVAVAKAESGSRILDVATGTGKVAFAFAREGHEVVGVDLSEDMLNVARRNNKYHNARFEIADGTSLPFEDGSFDVSSVSFALHDMIPAVREKVVKEMARVTKPRGTIMIVDYGLPHNKVSRFLIYNFVKLYEPYFPEFIKYDLNALLRKFGIEIEEEISVLRGAARILKGTRIVNAGRNSD